MGYWKKGTQRNQQGPLERLGTDSKGFRRKDSDDGRDVDEEEQEEMEKSVAKYPRANAEAKRWKSETSTPVCTQSTFS